MGMAAASAILLSVMRPQLFLFLLGLLSVSFIGTGYLAPRIGRGSQSGYRWDRVLTVLGGMAGLGFVSDGLVHSTLMAPFPTSLIFGSLGLWIAAAHWQWRGPANRLGWRIEHLTSLVAAYTVAWCSFSHSTSGYSHGQPNGWCLRSWGFLQSCGRAGDSGRGLREQRESPTRVP